MERRASALHKPGLFNARRELCASYGVLRLVAAFSGWRLGARGRKQAASLAFFCLLHLWLSGVTMAFLAERWTGNSLAGAVAGAAYAFNGLLLHSLMWPNNIAAFAWLPLTVLMVERAWRQGGRWIPAAALVGTLQMLSGAPEIILWASRGR